MTTKTAPETVTIEGRVYRTGDELVMFYGRGTQKVRIREITKNGRVKIDRFNGGYQTWDYTNTAIKVDDPRWPPAGWRK